MRRFAETSQRIAATTKKLEKTALLADYLKSVSVDEAATAAVFFSGRPFPMWEEATLQVGGRMLWQIVADISGASDERLTAAYRRYGDLGAAAEAVLPTETDSPSGGCPHPPQKNQTPFPPVFSARGAPGEKGKGNPPPKENTPRPNKKIIKKINTDAPPPP